MTNEQPPGCLRAISALIGAVKLVAGIIYAIAGSGPLWLPVASEFHWLFRLFFVEFFAIVWLYQALGFGG